MISVLLMGQSDCLIFRIQISDFIYFPFLYLSLSNMVDNNEMIVLKSDKYFHY